MDNIGRKYEKDEKKQAMDKQEKDLKKKIWEIVEGNMISGYSHRLDIKYMYTKPAESRYPFQYFWDTCFHIIILVNLEEYGHARQHLRSLLAVQNDDGLIGNIIYWKHIFPARYTDFFQMKLSSIFKLNAPHSSDIIQPPLLAQATKKIYDHTEDIDFVKEVLPKIKKYFNWLDRTRNLDNSGLITIITTFESGMDWKPTFDPVVGFRHGKANGKLFRRVVYNDFKNFIRNYNIKKIEKAAHFLVKDAGFNSIYSKDLKTLSELCQITDDKDAEIFSRRAEKVNKALVEILYDEKDKAFYDVYGKEYKKIRILTPTIFFPVILGEVPEDIGNEVMEKHFFHQDEFHADYPVPSVAKNDPSFYPKESMYIWRGPTWIVYNWFMHKYMIRTEKNEYAEKLMESVLKLINKSGFREYYNPFTGDGYGAHNFTWSGLVLDMMNNHKKNKAD